MQTRVLRSLPGGLGTFPRNSNCSDFAENARTAGPEQGCLFARSRRVPKCEKFNKKAGTSVPKKCSETSPSGTREGRNGTHPALRVGVSVPSGPYSATGSKKIPSAAAPRITKEKEKTMMTDERDRRERRKADCLEVLALSNGPTASTLNSSTLKPAPTSKTGPDLSKHEQPPSYS